MAGQVTTPTGKKAIYYQAEWSIYDRNYQVMDLPSRNLTDISYAFLDVTPSGDVKIIDEWAALQKPLIGGYLGNFGQLKKLKETNSFNLTIALGGWNNSKYFSDAVSTDQTRSNFVTSIVDFICNYPMFTGVGIDWEYLSDDGVNYGKEGNHVSKMDAQNFILFLQQLRKVLPAPDFTIALCTTADPQKAKWPIEAIHPLIDELHVMTYDFHSGAWAGETVTAHHTNLYESSFARLSADEAAKFYLSRGVPSTKIFIGGALYSRGFANTDGMGKPFQGDSPDMSWEQGIVDYKKLPVAGAVEKWDDEAKAGYSYDSSRRIVNSYDNVDSILEKAKYVHENSLGGMILWESSADFPYDDPRSIMRALHDNLTHDSGRDTPITKHRA